MEENKIFMPPPPKELKNMPPPPPPIPQSQPQEEVKEEQISFEEPVVEEIPQGVEKIEVSEVINEKTEKKKEKKKSSGGVKTIFYWCGFAVSLAAIAGLIVLLII